MEARKVWDEQRQAQLININNKNLSIKELKGQRVVTFKDIDMLHERVEGTANKRFIDNKKHFISNEDYFEVTGEILREFKQLPNFGIGEKASKLILLTESGYLMLVKSLTDDLAWKVQRELVNKYFRSKSGIKELSPQLQLLVNMELQQKKIVEQLNQVNHHALEAKDEINSLKKQYKEDRANDPLFNIECDELQKVVKRVATETLGGYKSPAYLDKSISGKVYSDVQRQIKREFGLRSYKAIKRSQLDIAIKIVEGYKAPLVLQQEIDLINNQLSM